MFIYFLALEVEEIDAIYFWRGRVSWADAASDYLRYESMHEPEEMPNGPGLYFETITEALDFKEQCESDVEGGHSMFSGVIDSFASKLMVFCDRII